VETVQIITATYQGINTAIPAACSSPAGAFGPADLEEPPGCFFPLGFRFLGSSAGFLWQIAWTFCQRPDLWQALQVFEKTSASFDGEQKGTKHNFFMCVCGHIL